MSSTRQSCLTGIEVPSAPGFHFPKDPTTAIYIFEIITFIFALSVLIYAWRKLSYGVVRFGLLCIGIFLFEFFTSPMWNNWNMSCGTYSYQDVNWLLTVGWAGVFLVVTTFIDKTAKEASELKRFGLSLLGLALIVPFLEAWVVNIGIRSYSPEVEAAILGVKVAGVPLEIFYYVPVFAALVISFYKYWMLVVEKYPIPPPRKMFNLKTLLIAFLGVFLFELMIEPMAINSGLPSWSYVYRDISILMTGAWVGLLCLVYFLVNRFFIDLDIGHRYLISLTLLAIFAIPLEAWFMLAGFRSYGQSAINNFSGYTFWGTAIPIEVSVAIPLYFGLIIPFVRYLTLPWLSHSQRQ